MTSSNAPRSHVLEGTRPATPPINWRYRLRQFGYTERLRSDTRERLVPPFPKPSTRLWEFLGF
ncbi:phospholipid carrier-dependent glycosyltransferase, partial [Streptomyces sp. NPDC002814]